MTRDSADPGADQKFPGRLSMLVQDAEAGKGGRGILFHAARDVTAADVVLMAQHGGICTVTINEPLALRLGLHPQGGVPEDGDAPYFVNSVEAVACSETGISARERALTMRTLGAPDVTANAIGSPGHVMVQAARNVLRDNATLPELANLFLAATTDTRFAAWSDVLNGQGELASAGECIQIADRTGILVFRSEDVIAAGKANLQPWFDLVEFSRQKFGN